MYACLHQASRSVAERELAPALLDLAYSFSPFVEQTDVATVVFAIDALQRTLGKPSQIAAAIVQRQQQRKIEAHVALASTPDCAILLAHYSEQKLVLTLEQDATALAPLPLTVLFEHDRSLPPDVLAILRNWGLVRCGDLAQLSEAGLVERLGSAGQVLRRLALGQHHRPLRLTPIATPYEEQIQLEYALDCVEPLLFLVSRSLIGFCERLRSQMLAARKLDVTLQLERDHPYQRTLDFAIPLHDHRSMLKLLQLDLDRHPPGAPVIGFTLRLEPVAPRRVQHHLLLPPTPAPDRLQLTLSRIAALIGESQIGTPELLNTFRPDAFRLFPPVDDQARRQLQVQDFLNPGLKLALRMFRPPLAARVHMDKDVPDYVVSQTASGQIVRASGPWRSSGEWWTPSRWASEEWDVALEDGAVYRLFREVPTHQWFLRGVYD